MKRKLIKVQEQPSFYEMVNKSIGTKEGEWWGYHLILDAQGCDAKIDDEEVVKQFIKELITELKMKAVGPPMIRKFGSAHMRDLSALQLITTSTITFHGDNDLMRVFLDVFSCKEYDPKLVFPLFKQHFNPKKLASIFILRNGDEIKVDDKSYL